MTGLVSDLACGFGLILGGVITHVGDAVFAPHLMTKGVAFAIGVVIHLPVGQWSGFVCAILCLHNNDGAVADPAPVGLT